MGLDTRQSFGESASVGGAYVAIEGVIGVGKTSLTRILNDRWSSSAYFEVVEKNPFLTSGFYENKTDLAFNTELFFLLSRYRQHQTLKENSGLIVSDYIFEKNFIFAKMNLHGDDLELYRHVYSSLTQKTRKPDLVVLLQADLETLMRRIYFRDREFERALSASYLEDLNQRYYDFFTGYTDAPVLRIACSGKDFVNDRADLEKICAQIEERLRGKVQLSFKPRAPKAPASRIEALEVNETNV